VLHTRSLSHAHTHTHTQCVKNCCRWAGGGRDRTTITRETCCSIKSLKSIQYGNISAYDTWTIYSFDRNILPPRIHPFIFTLLFSSTHFRPPVFTHLFLPTFLHPKSGWREMVTQWAKLKCVFIHRGWKWHSHAYCVWKCKFHQPRGWKLKGCFCRWWFFKVFLHQFGVWYKSFPTDHFGHMEMNISTMLSDKTSTAYSCAEDQILEHFIPQNRIFIFVLKDK